MTAILSRAVYFSTLHFARVSTMTLGAESGVPFCNLSSHSVADVKFGKSEKISRHLCCLLEQVIYLCYTYNDDG